MIKNYFKIAWRTLVKHKTFSVINIAGLAIGITSFLLIALYIFDELTFDGFHANARHIYRVVDAKTTAEGKQIKVGGAGYQITEKPSTDIPDVKAVARVAFFGRANMTAIENNHVFYEDFVLGNAGFFDVFDFPLLQGDRHTALTAPHSVVLTEEMAQKFFGTTQVLGKTLQSDRDSIPYNITGVLKNFPVNSHLSFNLMLSESSMTDNEYKNFINNDWDSDAFASYLLLLPNADTAAVAQKITQLAATNTKGSDKPKSSFILQPLQDIHFHSTDIEGGSGNTGSLSYLYIFSVLAVFVLFIACTNYMNLTTARFAGRAKEIAVRKVAGAMRGNLTLQFLIEAFLLTLIAVALALMLASWLLPAFNTFTQKRLVLGTGTDYRVWLIIALIPIVVSLLSGMYPALFQSGQKPLLLLKNKISVGKTNISLRRSLVVFQFTLSIVMIVATMVVYLQMKYVNTKDIGFQKDRLLVVDINSGNVRRGAETIKHEFAKLPQVMDVTVSSRVPGEWKNLPKVKVRNDGQNAAQASDMFFIGVDAAFTKTYGIQLLQGRNFEAGSNADSSAIIVNEMAARQLGITKASEQLVDIPSINFGSNFEPLNAPFKARVVGIVKDFNFQSLHQPMSAMVLAFQSNPIHSIDYFTVRLKGGDINTTVKQMDAVLHSIDQNHLFEHHFLDQQWNLFYREDQMRQTVFFIMALLAIAIACLGLFGLATFAAEQRVKEIGIRKVLGASVQSIVTMLSKDFLKLVLVAAVTAFPIAWFIMQKWLQDFAYKINISWWIFALSGALVVVIALITVSFQAIKAAVSNPVKSLRSE